MKAFRYWSGTRITFLAVAWVIGLPLALALVAMGLLRADVFVGVARRELFVLTGLIVIPPLLLVAGWYRARARGDGDRGAPT